MHYSNESNPGVQKHMIRTHMQSISRVFLVPVTSQFLFGPKCFQIRHFSSEDVEGGASWKKIFLFPRPLEADWHDELCNHLFAKLKVIWISCCADSLWPKMGEAWRKSKLSWGADTGAGESGYNRDYNQDNRDYNSVANRNYSWRSRSRNDCWPINGWRDQKRSACQGPWLKGVDSAHRGEQRCLLVWNSNSYI